MLLSLSIVCCSLVLNKQFSIIWIYYNLFIHSPTEGHLICLQFGAIMSKKAGFFNVDICFHFSRANFVGMRLLVSVCLTFQKLPVCFPKRLHCSTVLLAIQGNQGSSASLGSLSSSVDLSSLYELHTCL